MNIIKEQNDNLSLQLKISIEASDYQDRVKKELNKVRAKAQMPGFRQGHVPFGRIQQMYGLSILVDEINKILQESVGQFLEEEKIDLLGAPFPAQDAPKLDFEKDTAFDFILNVLLTPEVNLDFLKTLPTTYYKIKSTDAVVDEQITELRQRFGSAEETEGETHRKEAELNEEFFKKVFPHKEIKTEKELRQAIAEEHEKVCNETVDIWFFNTTFDPIIKAANLQYNDEMLRQYMEHQKETKHEDQEEEEESNKLLIVTDEEFEKIKKGTSWQLIQHKLMETYNIKVEHDEIKQAAREQISSYFGMAPEQADIQLGEYMVNMVDGVMKDKEQVQGLHTRMLDKKIVKVLKENTQITVKEATWEEFRKMIEPKKEETEEGTAAPAPKKTKKPSTSKKKKDTSEEITF
ncbi:MAG: trigger factor family protein [Bacteroidales bacterium]|nr:trigger factor family protein [Bacteroidales bacterium]